MPLFLVQRDFAEAIEVKGEDVKLWDEIYVDEGVRWLYSFLSADKRHAYCLYEAPSADVIRAAAKRTLPTDAIVEVSASTAEFVRCCQHHFSYVYLLIVWCHCRPPPWLRRSNAVTMLQTPRR